MAESTFLPPWLTRDYDPVGTFMRAYQTGAQISEAQTRLAEQQRQANMEAQARQEQLQQSALHDLINVQVTKAYHDQQASLANERLEEAKQRNAALAKQAADSLAQRIADANVMRAIQQENVDVRREQLEQGKIHFGTGGEIVQAQPDGTFKVLREGKPTEKATMGEAALAREDIKKKMEERDALKTALQNMKPTERTGFLGIGGEVVPRKEYGETQKKIADLEREIAGTTATSARPTKVEAPAEKSPYPEGTILRKKDGSRWIVKNGEPVPYGN